MKARVQQEFAKKWVGVVRIKSGDTQVKFTSVTKDKEGVVKKFPNGELEMKVKLADLPKIGQRVIRPNMEGKQFRIRLNDDGDEVEEVGPVNGMFAAKLVELGPKKKDAEVAAPYVKFYNRGKPDENSHLEFFAVYEIVEGVFKGLKLPAYYLHYKFEGIPEGEDSEGFTRYDTVDTAQASQLHRLQAWGELHGNIFDEPIEWNEDEADVSDDVLDCFAANHQGSFANILPELEERAVSSDTDVNVVLENGYVKIVQAAENYEEAEETEKDEVDEVYPPVKEEKKAPAKPTTKRVKKQADADEDL